ncbi:type 1 fimbrial protein [Herbaspirillum sp. LeCh32-8]|uniref:fimbrial protein n=1 Tax=Herbaspirillum sp. LeCh32-8 TaxID=2821356 RepID=UPI001AEAAE7A|nr:fimbrial protein [Herbaspirillum sp. LeCh32-8]MBP0598902.1 type 1 fimbrial protein [Herbaspirillum sp. LeCh32-8]
MNKLGIFLAMGAIAALAPATSFAYDAQINLSGVLTASTCVINAPNGTAVIGDFPVSAFTGIGSHSDWGKGDLVINLDCAGIASKVTVSLTDATTPGNTSNILSLTPSSTARGIGIEVWQASHDIYVYGPDTKTPGAPNQHLVFVGNGSATQLATLNFSVRYVQTANTVTPGSANGAATYTLQYQ